MCAYPFGLTLHAPSSSPSAASKPAATTSLTGHQLKSLIYRVRGNRARALTKDEIRCELEQDRHDDLGEGVEVVGVGAIRALPRDVDVLAEAVFRAAHIPVALGTVRVEVAVVVAVYGDVEDVAVLVEGLLDAVA